MKIQTREGIDYNYINKWLHENYEGLNSYVEDGFYNVIGVLSQEEENAITEFHSNIVPYAFEDSYMVNFLKEKYYINAEKGEEYVHEISAKTVMLIEKGEVTLEKAVLKEADAAKVSEELRRGYWHSAYLSHISYEPVEELQEIHEEIRQHIKEYVNDKYPETFRIE